MKNIFISYAHEDRGAAEELAHLLEKRGYNIWWDRRLEVGDKYRPKIRAQLDRADKVIVIWSRHSVDSSFVTDEAGVARRNDKLIPVSIDDAEPPLGFGDLHTLRTKRLKSDLESIVAAIEGARIPLGQATPSTRPYRHRIALVASGAVVVTLGAIVAGNSLFLAYRKTGAAECNLSGLDAKLDYQCYHSRKLKIRFVYPLAVLELDTVRQGDSTLRLRNLARERRADVVITRRPFAPVDLQKARDEEERKLRDQGFEPNHLKPEEGEQWANFYVITGWKPSRDIFYYKRWFVGSDVVSLEYDYAADDKKLYDRIITDMVKDRFQLDQ